MNLRGIILSVGLLMALFSKGSHHLLYIEQIDSFHSQWACEQAAWQVSQTVTLSDDYLVVFECSRSYGL